MKIFNIHQAKTHLSRLVEAAAKGEEIVIAKAGKPMARLIAMSAAAGPRSLGTLAGSVRESDDCWMPDPALEALFYGSRVEPVNKLRAAEPPPEQ